MFLAQNLDSDWPKVSEWNFCMHSVSDSSLIQIYEQWKGRNNIQIEDNTTGMTV